MKLVQCTQLRSLCWLSLNLFSWTMVDELIMPQISFLCTLIWNLNHATKLNRILSNPMKFNAKRKLKPYFKILSWYFGVHWVHKIKLVFTENNILHVHGNISICMPCNKYICLPLKVGFMNKLVLLYRFSCQQPEWAKAMLRTTFIDPTANKSASFSMTFDRKRITSMSLLIRISTRKGLSISIIFLTKLEV